MNTGVPVWAILLMLAGPVGLGIGRLVITVTGWMRARREPRPGYLDLREPRA